MSLAMSIVKYNNQIWFNWEIWYRRGSSDRFGFFAAWVHTGSGLMRKPELAKWPS